MWLLDAAGTKMINAVADVLDMPEDALDRTRNSLPDNGNLS
nr:hypothetical protein [Mycobacterium leprae]